MRDASRNSLRDASRNSFRCKDLCGKRTRAGWRTLSFFNSGGEGSAPASRRALEIGPFPGVRTQPAPPMRLTLTSKRTRGRLKAAERTSAGGRRGIQGQPLMP
jgi:hypothetical protein